MADWVGIKHALNSSLGTEYFRPLDQMISATMVLEGAPGTKFEVTNTTTGETFSVTLASGESKVIVPVPLGTYTIKVTFSGKSTTVNLTIDTLGKPYKVIYSIQLASFSSNGTFTVPSGVKTILVDAAAGGGGGGGGFNSDGSGSVYHPGGGGGGGGAKITQQKYAVTPGNTISITVGTGGSGGVAATNGTSGGSTIIGGLVSLVGGSGGNAAKYSTIGTGGSGGSPGGGSGKNGTSPTSTSHGTGGSGGSPNGGKGGNGSRNNVNGAKASDGTSGYVRIYMGVA